MIEIKLPKSIKVGGFDYKIDISLRRDKQLKDNDNWGEHSGRNREISIVSDCSPQQFSSTFIHEALHAVDCVYQQSELTDKQVSALSHGLHQVLEQLKIRFVKD